MYPQRVADLAITLHAFPADQRFVYDGDVGIRSVQLIDVIVNELVENLGRIGGVGDICPVVKVLLCVVQPPC